MRSRTKKKKKTKTKRITCTHHVLRKVWWSIGDCVIAIVFSGCLAFNFNLNNFFVVFCSLSDIDIVVSLFFAFKFDVRFMLNISSIAWNENKYLECI